MSGMFGLPALWITTLYIMNWLRILADIVQLYSILVHQ